MKVKSILLFAVLAGMMACNMQSGGRDQTKNMPADTSGILFKLSGSGYYRDAPYDFSHPQKTYVMPDILREISGIAIADSTTLYCIQDELGTIFKYDLREREVLGLLRFTDTGDFEDIAIRQDSVYVLRSDGTIFYFDQNNFRGKVRQKILPVNCTNIEGLTVSPIDRMMYVACKAPLSWEDRTSRQIYRFSSSNMGDIKKAFAVNEDEISRLAAEKYPFLENRKISFNPSAIAIHPQTGEKYILSASSRLIAVFNDQGLSQLYPLPAGIYYQPEGLAFTKSGDLFLSSEGKKKGHNPGKIFFLPRKK